MWRLQMNKKDRLQSIGVDLIEKHFPKGQCKERGAAIVLFAKLSIAILKEFEGLEKDLAFYKKWMIVYKKRSKQLKQSQLTKEEFHTIACEYIPKWTKGELDKLWEALTEGHWLNIDRPKQRELDDEIFIKHIQSHLQEGQKVICKICGKTVEEIATAFKKGKL